MIGLAWNERSSVELPCPETDALAPGLVLCVRHASQLIAKVVPWTRERLRCGRSSEQSDESRPSESLDGSTYVKLSQAHSAIDKKRLDGSSSPELLVLGRRPSVAAGLRASPKHSGRWE